MQLIAQAVRARIVPTRWVEPLGATVWLPMLFTVLDRLVQRHNLVTLAGFEPATFGLGNRYALHCAIGSKLAAPAGNDPTSSGSEPDVLPLNDRAASATVNFVFVTPLLRRIRLTLVSGVGLSAGLTPALPAIIHAPCAMLALAMLFKPSLFLMALIATDYAFRQLR